MRTVVGPLVSAIREVPRVGAYVVVVIAGDGPDYSVPNATLRYLPPESRGAGMFEVNDLADPLIHKTLKGLQELRREEHLKTKKDSKPTHP